MSKKQIDYQTYLSESDLAWVLNIQKTYADSIDPKVLRAIPYIVYVSEYAKETIKKDPDRLLQFGFDRDYRKPIKSEHIEQSLADLMQDIKILDDATVIFRQFRHLHHLRILVNDLLNIFTPYQTMIELSHVSDCIIRQAVIFAHRYHCRQQAFDEWKIAPLTIIAVGKLGGRELNFSSDIDLILGFPVSWEDENDCAQNFYHREAQTFIRLLNHKTQDGFVYRVDLRLRPFGEEGALVLPYSGFEHYYVNHGRPWERYALIKARIIFGENENEIERIIQRFVYKNYIDKSAIDTLHRLKLLIGKEVLSRQLQNDIKRGPGGIRQIEFIVQLFQLVYGGEDVGLQKGSWRGALQILYRRRYVTAIQFRFLEESYIFLRKLEHCLQIYRDKQTHAIPKDEEACLRLAHSMGYVDWGKLNEVIHETRKKVNELFESLLRDSHEAHPKLLRETSHIVSSIEYLTIKNFKEGEFYQNLSDIAKQFCSDLLNALCMIVDKTEEDLVDKFVSLLEAIADNDGYIVLFRTHTTLLQQIISLFRQSPWCARNLNQFPSLLHELASLTPLTAPYQTDKLSDELRQMLLSIPRDDVDEISEALRKFKLRQFMRVAYSDVSDTLPLMKVSDHLTFTAESIVRYLYRMVVTHAQGKHPDLDETLLSSFSIIAYGKLGGIELSYQSDLDLVFLHEAGIEHERILTRMAQRIIELLERPLRSGKLYDVDTRLRPSGHSGLMVNSFSAFSDYMEQSAWTWECQSLIRSRFIAGTDKARATFNAIRLKILTMPRDAKTLKRDVKDMRERLRQQRKLQSESEAFRVISDAVKDIEFIVQYLSLYYANQYPEIIKWSDNIRILEEISKRDIIPSTNALKLIECYQLLRAKLHEFSLKETLLLESDIISNIEFIREQESKILV